MADGKLALVFDDGYATDRSTVLPVLRDADATAVFAVVPEWIGEDEYLTGTDLGELADWGCEIAAHGRRHRYLQALRIAAPVEAGDERAFVDGDVSPDGDRRLFPGDDYEVADGTTSERIRVAETGSEDGDHYLAVEGTFDADYAAEQTVVRPTEDVLEEEVLGVRRDLREMGHDPATFVFPYDAADARAWTLAAREYDVVANAAVRSLPNLPGGELTDLRRYYLETTAMRRPGIATYLDAVADSGGLGILAGHSAWDSVTPERIAWTIRAARDRGIDVTTFRTVVSERE